LICVKAKLISHFFSGFMAHGNIKIGLCDCGFCFHNIVVAVIGLDGNGLSLGFSQGVIITKLPMSIKLYTDIHEFYYETYDALMCHEAQSMIGNEGTIKPVGSNPANWLMTTVLDESGILLTAIITPPHNITLYAADNQIDSRSVTV
jgi:hypothetical protein